MIKYTGNLRADFDKATAEITRLSDRILGYQDTIKSLRATANNLRKSKESAKKRFEETLAEKDAVIKELQNRLAHLSKEPCLTGLPNIAPIIFYGLKTSVCFPYK